MKKLPLLILIALFASYQTTAARKHDTCNISDSVYLFSYSTISDDGRSGLRFAWSHDKENWFEIGKNFGYLKCDYGRWGTQKKMLDPYLKQMSDGSWLCTWMLNDTEGFGQAYSKDLIYWRSQKYPRRTNDFEGIRVNATIGGEKQKGSINRVAWKVADKLIQNYGWNQYRNQQYNERSIDDNVRFAGLKPVKAKITAMPGNSKKISDMLLGIFFEDISYAADGGLYAELVQNRDFEYTPSDQEGKPEWNSRHSWTSQGNQLSFGIDSVRPLHANNPHYAVLDIEEDGGKLCNAGFDGIAINAGERYDFSIFARTPKGGNNRLTIRLVDNDGSVCGEASLLISSQKWKQYKSVITASRTADTHLEIIPQKTGTIHLDMVSLFPEKTFKGRKNGLRADLAQVIEDIHPKFVRFPGGCVAHGDGLHNIYKWKETIGPLEARKPQRNLWGYHQTKGLGYFEYFQFCEDIQAEPLPVLAAGVPCQNSASQGNLRGGQQGGIPMDEMQAYIQDILDLIEWANGDAKHTKWGKARADAGHPKPFNLKYIGIGNEDLISDVFIERFTLIFNAIKEKHPEITVVGTVGPFNEGTDYTEGWKLADKLGIPLVDEHYYQTPGWFLHNQDFYDKYDRSKKTKVYLGEYATHLPDREANLETALTEALYLTALERNGDIVEMSSYAPLLAKEGHKNWNPDLIYFNNREIKPTTGYYVQKLYGENSGDEYLPAQVRLDNKEEAVQKRFGSSIVRDKASGDIIVKLVNLLPVEISSTISLPGADKMQTIAQRTVLTGKLADKPLPKENTITVSDNFECLLPAYSFTVIRIKNKVSHSNKNE